jgi:hypothetical protein
MGLAVAKTPAVFTNNQYGVTWEMLPDDVLQEYLERILHLLENRIHGPYFVYVLVFGKTTASRLASKGECIIARLNRTPERQIAVKAKAKDGSAVGWRSAQTWVVREKRVDVIDDDDEDGGDGGDGGDSDSKSVEDIGIGLDPQPGDAEHIVNTPEAVETTEDAPEEDWEDLYRISEDVQPSNDNDVPPSIGRRNEGKDIGSQVRRMGRLSLSSGSSDDYNTMSEDEESGGEGSDSGRHPQERQDQGNDEPKGAENRKRSREDSSSEDDDEDSDYVEPKRRVARR